MTILRPDTVPGIDDQEVENKRYGPGKASAEVKFKKSFLRREVNVPNKGIIETNMKRSSGVLLLCLIIRVF